MLSNMIVIIIVALAVFFIGRRFYRNITNKNSGCHCDATDECSTCIQSNKYEGTNDDK